MRPRPTIYTPPIISPAFSAPQSRPDTLLGVQRIGFFPGAPGLFRLIRGGIVAVELPRLARQKGRGHIHAAHVDNGPAVVLKGFVFFHLSYRWQTT